MNLTEAADLYVAEAGRVNTSSSKVSFRGVISHLDKFLGGDREIVDVSTDDLTEWCLSGPNPAPSTVKKRRAHARSFFGWLAYRKLVPENVASDLQYSVRPGTGPVRTHTWLTEDQTMDLLMVPLFPTVPEERDHIILLLGVMCGLRAGVEMAALRWDWFNRDLTELTVHEGKGRKTVTIGVPPRVGDALREWRKRGPATLTGPVLPRTRWVWDPHSRRQTLAVEWDQPLGYAGIHAAVKRAGDRIGVPLRPHDLRRTFAGLLESKGVPVTDISRAMRHGDVGTTSRYLEKNSARTVQVTAQFELSRPAGGGTS